MLGRLAGTVLFRGAIPPKTMYIAEAGDLEAHVPIVDAATRGLKAAVVWLEPPAAAELTPPVPRQTPHLVDQANFTFVPHVLAVRKGEDVRFTNSDNANHNIHCLDSRQAFNLASTPGLEVVRRFAAPADGRPLELRCDVHSWMKAWVYVFDHPWFAVTDARGRFELGDVPVGEHTLRIAHADGGLAASAKVRVTAEAGDQVTIEVGESASASR
jgi:plastocyanin